MDREEILQDLARRCENYIDELYQGKHYELSLAYRDGWHTCMMYFDKIIQIELKRKEKENNERQ